MKKYRGVFPALYACYDSTGRVSPRQVRLLTRRLCESGVSGLYINGSPGDSARLSVREKIEVMENVMAEARGRVLVLCHVSCGQPEDTAELIRRAVSSGADAVVAGPGVYADDTLDMWRAFSDAAAGMDTVFCDAPLPADDGERERYIRFASETEMKGIIPANSAVTDIALWREMLPETVSIFSARETEAASAIAMGADAVTGRFCAVMPDLMVRLESTIRYAGLHRAAADQDQMLRICAQLESCAEPLQAARYAVRRVTGVDPGPGRDGTETLSDTDRMNADRVCAMLSGR